MINFLQSNGQYYLREKAKYDASRVMMKYNGYQEGRMRRGY